MRQIALAVTLGLVAQPSLSATRAESEELAAALGLPEIIEVMREEGLDHGADMAADMFTGRGGSAWTQTVETIYDPGVMEATVLNRMAEDLADTDISELLEFFTSERGRQIIGYEVSARTALLDKDIEEAAKLRLEDMRTEGTEQLALIERFVEVNDLVESNVMGAMNSNYAFYQGLIEGDAFSGSMTESDAVADVWAQENEIRAETDTWVHAYLAMAYQPLSRDDMEAYIAISDTPAGRSLNRALFRGFDEMYVEISRSLGAAAARFMAGQDI